MFAGDSPAGVVPYTIGRSDKQQGKTSPRDWQSVPTIWSGMVRVVGQRILFQRLEDI